MKTPPYHISLLFGAEHSGHRISYLFYLLVINILQQVVNKSEGYHRPLLYL